MPANAAAGARLSVGSLTALGVSNTIGAGIFVLTGTVAAHNAGPAVSLSYLLAGLACLCVGLCYAELAAMCPGAGSAYTYAYVAVGQLAAWVIGWDLLLEFLFAGATVSVGWSGYLTGLIHSFGGSLPEGLTDSPLAVSLDHHLVLSGKWFNGSAAALVGFQAYLLARGVRETQIFMNAAVAVLIGVVVVVIMAGTPHIRIENYQPFIPSNSGEFGAFGWSGVMQGAAIVFFSYTGFEAISTATREAKNAQRDLPRALLGALATCGVLYVLTALVLTGLARFSTLDTSEPVIAAISGAGASLSWLIPVVRIGLVFGLSASSMASMYAQTRIFHAMANDGLVPAALARVDPKRGTPTVATTIVGIASFLIAGLLPLSILGELVSIGTLFAFATVCISVAVLRFRIPDRPRPFRAPLVGVVASVGVITCACLMASLPAATWIRFGAWLLLGVVLYAAYRYRAQRYKIK